jgi:hypothetical protein
MSNIPEDRRYGLHRGESLKSSFSGFVFQLFTKQKGNPICIAGKCYIFKILLHLPYYDLSKKKSEIYRNQSVCSPSKLLAAFHETFVKSDKNTWQ